MRLRNQLVIAAENLSREENSSPVKIPTLSKDTYGQLNRAHKVTNVMNLSNRNNCVTLLHYNADKPDNSYAQVRLIARKKEDEKFQQVVSVNYKLEEFIYLLDIMISVYDKIVTNQPICNVL